MKKVLFILLFLAMFCPDIKANNLDSKIAQMIIVGFEGDSIHSPGFKKILNQIENNEISGVIIFAKNIKSKKDLIEMNKKILSKAKITPFIAIDNEGGYVQRYDFIDSKSAKEVSKLDMDSIKQEYSKMAQLEKELKINFNFAPCVDLELEKNSIISKSERSYGNEPEKVVEIAKIFISEHNKRKIITSIKHFPGHGSTKGDTHKGFVDATNTFSDKELIPYFKLSKSDKLNTVMVSHIFNSDFDKNYPASLSKSTIDFLKNRINYQGLIVSDDYDMGAIRKNYTLRQIVVNSINSGVNIMLFSNNIDKKDKNLALKIRKIIKEEIKKGTIKEEAIEDSYKKIIELKKNLE